MLPSKYNLLRYGLNYLRFADFYLFLFEVAALIDLAKAPEISDIFASSGIITSAFN